MNVAMPNGVHLLEGIANHEFYSRAIEGTLTNQQLAVYLAQDNLYLEEFEAHLGCLASRLRSRHSKATARRHQRVTIGTIASQGSFVKRVLCLPSALKERARPTTYAYINHLRRNRNSSNAGVVVALLPCYLFYGKAVQRLTKEGSKNPTISEWVKGLPTEEENDQYCGEILEIYRREAPGRSVRELAETYSRSAAYEILFLDMALHDERWPQTV